MSLPPSGGPAIENAPMTTMYVPPMPASSPRAASANSGTSVMEFVMAPMKNEIASVTSMGNEVKNFGLRMGSDERRSATTSTAVLRAAPTISATGTKGTTERGDEPGSSVMDWIQSSTRNTMATSAADPSASILPVEPRSPLGRTNTPATMARMPKGRHA